MFDDTHDLDLPPALDLAVNPLAEIQRPAPELPPPALIADAMVPEIIAGEHRIRSRRVSHEAAGCVRIQGKQKWDEQMVRVPERLVRLLADPGVRRRVHQKHAQEHDVARDAAGLAVVDLHGGFGANLGSLDVEEIDIMRRHVDARPEEQRICHLPMEPLGFIQRQESDLRPQPPKHVLAHRKEDESSIDRQYQPRSSRQPYRKRQGIKAR